MMLAVSSPVTLVPLEQDVLAQLLRDKRSPNTRRTYAKALKDFLRTWFSLELSLEN